MTVKASNISISSGRGCFFAESFSYKKDQTDDDHPKNIEINEKVKRIITVEDTQDRPIKQKHPDTKKQGMKTGCSQ